MGDPPLKRSPNLFLSLAEDPMDGMRTKRLTYWLLLGTLLCSGGFRSRPAFANVTPTGGWNGAEFVPRAEKQDEDLVSMWEIYVFLTMGTVVPYLMLQGTLRDIRRAMKTALSADGKTHYVQAA
jgi:hypothetical protein